MKIYFCINSRYHIICWHAKRLKIKILQASTSEIYEGAEVHPQPESYCGNVNPIDLRACYDEDKRCAETFGSGNCLYSLNRLF
jgi:hypothetical protein